jgi:hypothetical protein
MSLLLPLLSDSNSVKKAKTPRAVLSQPAASPSLPKHLPGHSLSSPSLLNRPHVLSLLPLR